jgi:O-antigen/teichoic acid export membrane protein
MFLVMGVTLYTSRIVLEQLGVSDYGVYSIVGGIVALFGFLNSSMSSATQRYLAFDLGKKDDKKLQKTFSATLTIHLAIAIIILFFAETLGLWYVNYKVILPPERLFAANVVYQFSVLTALIGIIQVPYDSLIMAYEKMNIYAYISIVEVSLKLTLVFFLVYYPGDKLIAYGAMLFLVSFIIRIAYQIYCKKKYVVSKYKFEYDKIYFNELISYSGWNLFGGLASVSRGQGINIVLNLFFGTVANAAYGLTLQVQSATNQFVSNFQRAVNPQIIKSYSEGNIERMHKLIIQSSKFSFILMILLVAPIIFNIDFILNFWLKTPPEYSSVFIRLSLITVLIDSISYPFQTGIQATGKIKTYLMVVGGIIMLALPITGVWLYYGGSAEVSFYSILVSSSLALFSRLYFMLKLTGMPIKLFLVDVGLRIVVILIGIYLLTLLLNYTLGLQKGWWGLITIEIITLINVLLLGLSKRDFNLLKTFLRKQ